MKEAEPLESILKRLRLSILEWWIIRLIGMWPIPKDKVALTARNHLTRDEQSQYAIDAFEDAVHRCVTKGWLTIVDDGFLLKLKGRRRALPEASPVYGWPALGDVEFTRRGARLFCTIRHCLLGPRFGRKHAYEVCVSKKLRIYYLSKEFASNMYESLSKDPATISVTLPCHVNSWRLYWWERHRRGYFIDVETRDVDWELRE
jgi:hypothetical protein